METGGTVLIFTLCWSLESGKQIESIFQLYKQSVVAYAMFGLRLKGPKCTFSSKELQLLWDQCTFAVFQC